MPARIPEESLVAIEQAVAQHPDGASFGDVAAAVPERVADRTLQYRLRYLVDKGRLIKDGQGRRWTRYRVPAPAAEPRAAAEKPAAVPAAAEKAEEAAVPLTAASQECAPICASPSIRASRLATTVNSSTHAGPTRRSIFRKNSAPISRRSASPTLTIGQRALMQSRC